MAYRGGTGGGNSFHIGDRFLFSDCDTELHRAIELDLLVCFAELYFPATTGSGEPYLKMLASAGPSAWGMWTRTLLRCSSG